MGSGACASDFACGVAPSQSQGTTPSDLFRKEQGKRGQWGRKKILGLIRGTDHFLSPSRALRVVLSADVALLLPCLPAVALFIFLSLLHRKDWGHFLAHLVILPHHNLIGRRGLFLIPFYPPL